MDHDEVTRLVMKRIGERWTYDVLSKLAHGTCRFRELLRALESVRPKVLSETLVRLENDGFIRRMIVDDRPPQVRYQLSELGTGMLYLMRSIEHWAAENRAVIAPADENERTAVKTPSTAHDEGVAKFFAKAPEEYPPFGGAADL